LRGKRKSDIASPDPIRTFSGWAQQEDKAGRVSTLGWSKISLWIKERIRGQILRLNLKYYRA